jgi:NADH-quinone oxidoreductase subunit A
MVDGRRSRRAAFAAWPSGPSQWLARLKCCAGRAAALTLMVRCSSQCRWRRRSKPSRHAHMDQLFYDYLPIAIFIGVALFIALALMAVPFMIAVNNPDPEKVSAYECGFNAFDDARMKFDVRFYLVAILFIIFDLEVAFLFPWAVAFADLGTYGYWSMMLFLGVLTVGFIYEWRKGALEWD